MKAQARILPDAGQLITAATEHFVATARNAIAKRGVFYVALAGGSTPKGLYEKLATEPASSPLRAMLTEIEELPFLAIESDGSPFPQVITAKLETFCLRAERLHERMLSGRKDN